MGFYVNDTDFTGKFEISQGLYTNNNLNDYISRYELKYLKELLGIELFNLYYADADAQPNKIPSIQRFNFIYGPFDYQFSKAYGNNNIIMSKGIKDMLIGFIWFEFKKDDIAKETPLGLTKQNSETSEGDVTTLFYLRYNESIKTYQAIQDYIVLSGNYPEFNGVLKQYAYWL